MKLGAILHKIADGKNTEGKIREDLLTQYRVRIASHPDILLLKDMEKVACDGKYELILPKSKVIIPPPKDFYDEGIFLAEGKYGTVKYTFVDAR